jgi:hypothetical protein
MDFFFKSPKGIESDKFYFATLLQGGHLWFFTSFSTHFKRRWLKNGTLEKVWD